MTRRAWLGALPFLLTLARPAAFAHVGSPNVVFEGQAGRYPVRVVVRPPDVVPGLADISVRVLEGDAASVTVQPFWWGAATQKGAPPPDVAAPVRGEPALFASSLWLMTGGSYAVRVSVSGAQGAGEVLVPVAALPARVTRMPPAFGALLLALGALLYAGSVSIVRAAVGEAVLEPGTDTAPRRRRAVLGASLAALLLGLLLAGLWRWWGDVDAAYQRRVYTPPRLAATSRADARGVSLRLAIEAEGPPPAPLTPDHGKLMHLFLVREPGHDVLAHLHPARVEGPETFETPLPPLTAGRYRVFADVTHETGLSQTLTGSVTLPEPGSAGGAAAGDPDDSFFVARESESEGYVVQQEPPATPLVAGREVSLRFRLVDAAGRAVAPEPYMGMPAHAVVLRDDASVFIHLHPTGTISMASQQLFGAKLGGAPADDHSAHAAVASGPEPTLAFPYAFPKQGRYRIWVQAKAAGVVRTGAFDVSVGPAP